MTGRDFTPYQRKVIGRFYDHRQTIHLTKLQELASEIALLPAGGAHAGRRDRLWKSAHDYLVKLGLSAQRAGAIRESQDPARLAQAVAELARA